MTTRMTKKNPLTRSKFSQGFPALPLREGLLLCQKSKGIFGFLHKSYFNLCLLQMDML